jgi:predicted MPP superfamily phosphohydrolase
MSFLFSVTAVRDLIFWPSQFFAPKVFDLVFSAHGSVGLLALATLGLLYGAWQAASGPRIIAVQVPIRNLPRGLHGFKIAQISDLHVGPKIGAKYVQRVVKKVRELEPNLTVLTGDIADGDLKHLREAVLPLQQLGSPSLYVPGNHEYYWDGPSWIRHFEALGLEPLLNSNKLIEHNEQTILVAGVVDPAARMVHSGLRPDAALAMGPKNDKASVKILLAHNPSIAREAERVGFDLQISGHTHAGQFFPWTLVVRHVHEFSKGLKACGTMWVYVNQGTGSWGPQVRFGSSTEITLLTLTPA